MAFNPSNSHWIPGYTSDGTNITIPIADIPGLTAPEAHTTTGDVRKLLYHLLELLNAAWAAEDSANLPAEWQQVKGQALNPSTGQITATYSHTFKLTPGSVEVTDEP